MKITPDFIPHTQFHQGVWLLSTSRPDWYYFMKKRNSNAIHNKSFLESVDGPLKELVSFLHRKGIKTTPSCSGHHRSEKNYERIYDSLEKDATDIKGEGLTLKDIETGKEYMYRDKDYSLPWNRKDFMEKVIVYQQKGVLGIRLGNRKKVKQQILRLQIPGVHIEEIDSIVFIHTNEDSNGDNKHTWKAITSMVKKAFAQVFSK